MIVNWCVLERRLLNRYSIEVVQWIICLGLSWKGYVLLFVLVLFFLAFICGLIGLLDLYLFFIFIFFPFGLGRLNESMGRCNCLVSVSVSVFPGDDLYLVSLFIWIVILNIFSEDLKELCVGMVQMVSCLLELKIFSLTLLKFFLVIILRINLIDFSFIRNC